MRSVALVSYDGGLSIAIVVRRRQWLEAMELFIAVSALMLVHGRRCTPRRHGGVARYNVTYTAELCSSSNLICLIELINELIHAFIFTVTIVYC